MKRNPYLTVFSYAKRERFPRVTATQRKYVEQQAASSRRPLILPSKWDIRWQDSRGRFTRFYTGKRLRGVMLARYAKGTRLSAKERLSRDRKRLSGRRYRVRKWLEKSFKLVVQLHRLAVRYPHRIPFYSRKADILYGRFMERRERAVALGGVSPESITEWEAEFDSLMEALGREKKPTQWVPVNDFMYRMIAKAPWHFTPNAWNDEAKIARAKFKGSFPMNWIRVVNGDPMLHSEDTANLLITDDKLAETDLDRFRSESFNYFVVGQMTKAQDHLVDSYGRFIKSPSARVADSMVAVPSMRRKGLGRWPKESELRAAVEKQKKEDARYAEVVSKEGPTLAQLRQSKPGRYVLLACTLVIRREYRREDKTASRDKTLREAHDFFFRTPQRVSKGGNRNRKYALSGKGGYPVFVFGNQPVWMEVFQRFYWAKGLYIIPRLFLGYTPREMSKEGGAG